jgi:AcrR family transcriptional regulator
MQRKTSYKKSAETKKKIYDSAISLINDKGFNYVTISEITARAQVAKGAFYYYFQSKEDVIKYTYQLADTYYEAAFERCSNLKGFERKLICFILSAYHDLEQLGKETITASINLALSTNINPFSGDRSFNRCLKIIFEESISHDEVRNMCFEEFLSSLVACLIGAEYLWGITHGDDSLVQIVERNLRIYLTGIMLQR